MKKITKDEKNMMEVNVFVRKEKPKYWAVTPDEKAILKEEYRQRKAEEDFNSDGFFHSGKKFVRGGFFNGYETCCSRNCYECPWGSSEEDCKLREE